MSKEFFTKPNTNKSIRRYTQLLAWMFSSIKLERGSGTNTQIVEMPIVISGNQAYFKSKRVQKDDVIRYRTVLPRAGLQFVSMVRDTMRQTTRAERIRGNNNTSDNRSPYDFNFTLTCKVKTRSEALQLIELMCVRFDPYVCLTINDNKSLNIKQDIIVELMDQNYEDDFEGDFEDARDIQVPFEFKVKGYIYDVSETSNIIERVRIDLSADGEGQHDWIDVSSGGDAQ